MLCGGQVISCGCWSDENDNPVTHDVELETWTGFWPGYAECVEYGIYCHWVEPTPGRPLNPGVTTGWVPCDLSLPDATPGLNQLHARCVWSRELRKFVLRPPKIITNVNTNSRGIDLT
jgi:hypothetical protein